MMNKYGGYCYRCGGWVPPRAGEARRIYDASEDAYNWQVFHLDKAECEQVQERVKLALAHEEAIRDAELKLAEVFWTAEKAPLPEGAEIVIDKRTIYGTGYAIAMDEFYVYHIDPNGMDGDMWSENNAPEGIVKRELKTRSLMDVINTIKEGMKNA